MSDVTLLLNAIEAGEPKGGRGGDSRSIHGGRPCFVMELVRGIKITEYCDQNQLPTRERLDLLWRGCGRGTRSSRRP